MPKIPSEIEPKVPSKTKPSIPLWKGPEIDGITFSMLSRFLVCRERFRINVIEGLTTRDEFNHKLHFGQMWHLCEETLAGYNEGGKYQQGKPDIWEPALASYGKKLQQKYPLAREQINHWYMVCKALFPIYVKHWSEHPDVLHRKPLLQEWVFKVPYKLPSGRTLILRGKIDSSDLVGEKNPGVYIQENKTKSSIDREKLARQLTFDLQTMMYFVALLEALSLHKQGGDVGLPEEFLYSRKQIKGVRYNVVRRSAHKTVESMLKKVNEDNKNNRTNEWFDRFKVEITQGDVDTFKQQCLDPLLEQVCHWYDVQVGNKVTALPNWVVHYRYPYGVWNPMLEGGVSDMDNYLATGSEAGLRRVNKLFTELEGDEC